MSDRGVLVEIYKLYAAVIVTGIDGAVRRIKCKTERSGREEERV